MRISDNYFYNSFKQRQQTSMGNMTSVSNQLASGRKIQDSFDDSSIFTDVMRLDNEEATMEQVKTATSKGEQYIQSTDTILTQLTSSLDQFKQKLIQANNQSNSQTSLDAIAKDLSGLRDHILSLANTSINGQYIFSGSALQTKPVTDSGNYQGNGQTMNTVIGYGVELPYNIDGESLFLGRDTDYKKILSTNVALTNTNDTESYLTTSDTIRDLFGDKDSDVTNNPDAVFYVNGRKSNGETFSVKLREASDVSIETLLDDIGALYGNSDNSKYVEVEMNNNGQIEITDLKNGNTLLDFSMIAAIDKDAAAGTVGNADQASTVNLLKQNNVDIKTFTISDMYPDKITSTISSSQLYYEQNAYTINDTLKLRNGEYAEGSDNLQELIGSDVLNIEITGIKPDGQTIDDGTGGAFGEANFTVNANTTVQDLLDAVEKSFEVDGVQNVTASLKDGQIFLRDNTPIYENYASGITYSKDDLVYDESTGIIYKADETGKALTDNPASSSNAGGISFSVYKDYPDYANGAAYTKGDIVFDPATKKLYVADATGNSNNANPTLSGGAGITFTAYTHPTSLGNVTLNLKAEDGIDGNAIKAFSGPEGFVVNNNYFDKQTNRLTSNASQYVKDTGAYATNSTKIIDVAGINEGPNYTLDGESLNLTYTDISGNERHAQIDFLTTGSQFKVDLDGDGTYDPLANEVFDIFDANGNVVKADEMTYSQLNDVVTMLMANQLPADGADINTTVDFAEYKKALTTAKNMAVVNLDYRGRMTVEDLVNKNATSKVELAIFDANEGYKDYAHATAYKKGDIVYNPDDGKLYKADADGTSNGADPTLSGGAGITFTLYDDMGIKNDGAVLSFQSNNALTIQNSYVDFFQELDEMIESLESGKYRADGTTDTNKRNVGLQNSLTRIDHLSDHVTKKHTEAGALQNSMQNAYDRSNIIQLNVIETRSIIADTDTAEALMKFQQLQNNYQAMLLTTTKISQMSLLNYM